MDANLSARLRLAREKRGLSARGLDRAASLHQGHVAQIERGEIRKLETDTLGKLARALDVPLGWLGWGEGEMPSWTLVRGESASDPAEATHAPGA